MAASSARSGILSIDTRDEQYLPLEIVFSRLNVAASDCRGSTPKLRPP